MKCLCINFDYYLYPKDVDNVSSFGQYLNSTRSRFICLKKLSGDNCKFPFFVEEDITDCLMNIERIDDVYEPVEDVQIIPREKYNTKLLEAVRIKCINCKNYSDGCEEDLDPYMGRLNLNGKCEWFEKK